MTSCLLSDSPLDFRAHEIVTVVFTPWSLKNEHSKFRSSVSLPGRNAMTRLLLEEMDEVE